MFLFAKQPRHFSAKQRPGGFMPGPKNTKGGGVTMICERGCLKHVHVFFCEMSCSWCSKSKHHFEVCSFPCYTEISSISVVRQFHPRISFSAAPWESMVPSGAFFPPAVIMCECKRRAGNPPGGFQCIQAVMRLCCGPTTSRKHVDPDSSGKKNISFDYLLPFFVVQKKSWKNQGM